MFYNIISKQLDNLLGLSGVTDALSELVYPLNDLDLNINE
jgi:hypothetical protein